MQLGKVIGSIVATEKTGGIDGMKLYVVSQFDETLTLTGETTACVDTVNAKRGDVVLTCSSSSARKTAATKGKCVDHVIVGIVDRIASNRTDWYIR